MLGIFSIPGGWLGGVYGPGTGAGGVSFGFSLAGSGVIGRPGRDELQCFVAGRKSRLKSNTTSIDSHMGTRGSATFTLYSPPGISPTKPRTNQDVKITDRRSGRVEFAGQIEKVVETIPPGTTAFFWVCTASDYSAVLDRRTVDKTFAAGPAAPIIIDAVALFLAGENVTTHHVTTTATIAAERAFNAKTFTEFMNELCAETGDIWFIDETNDLHCYAPGVGGGVAPFTITATNDTVRDLSVTRTLVGFANEVFVRSDQNLGEEDPLV